MDKYLEDFIYGAIKANEISEDLNDIEDFGLFVTIICTVFHDRCIAEGVDVPKAAKRMYDTILDVHEENQKL